MWPCSSPPPSRSSSLCSSWCRSWVRPWRFVTSDDFTWGSLNEIGWFPRRGFFDIGTLIVGSLIVTVIAMVVAWPLGVGAAIDLSEYAQPRVRRVLKPVLEILAGIPSVVLGFFALTAISPTWSRGSSPTPRSSTCWRPAWGWGS